MRFLILLAVAVVGVGCASKPESPQVVGRPGHIKLGSPALMKVGMTREELVSKMGPPASVSKSGDNKEVVYYVEERGRVWKNVRVVLINGRVSDFDRVQ